MVFYICLTTFPHLIYFLHAAQDVVWPQLIVFWNPSAQLFCLLFLHTIYSCLLLFVATHLEGAIKRSFTYLSKITLLLNLTQFYQKHFGQLFAHLTFNSKALHHNMFFCHFNQPIQSSVDFFHLIEDAAISMEKHLDQQIADYFDKMVAQDTLPDACVFTWLFEAFWHYCTSRNIPVIEQVHSKLCCLFAKYLDY